MNDIYKGPLFGANIAGEGGASSKVEIDDLGNNLHFAASEVDYKGAVVKDGDGRFQRLYLSDLGNGGVEVHLGTNNNPRLGPGDKKEVAVGSLRVIVEGTSDEGVLFNGTAPPIINDATEHIRYPR